jgi:hypothetical protein
MQIDHINCNSTDNKIENLRMVICQQNRENQIRSHKDSSTGRIGVSMVKNAKLKKFRVQLKTKREIICKNFSCIIEAEDFYLKTKRKHHKFSTI